MPINVFEKPDPWFDHLTNKGQPVQQLSTFTHAQPVNSGELRMGFRDQLHHSVLDTHDLVSARQLALLETEARIAHLRSSTLLRTP